MWRFVVPIIGVAMGLGSPALAGAFDLSHASVPEEEIVSGGPPKDGIPALTDPAVMAAEAATFLRPDDRVLGVEWHGQARAYPIQILNWHEVVNDRVGGAPIAVTYCPLCGTGMVFDANHEGTRVTFGVSGLLYNSDVLLYDRTTESLWSQLGMEAVAGPRVGDRLTWLPVAHTTWAAWYAAHPTTDVLSLQTGYRRDYARDPYASYGASARLMFPVRHRDDRLATKAWVLGVLLNGEPKAYPLDRLPNGPMLEDALGGQQVRIRYDAAARSASVTDQDGQPIPAVQAYWFAWAAFYPDTVIYELEQIDE